MKEVLTRVFWTTWLSSFTIEFALMFSKMSHGVLGVLRTDLALDKVYRYSGSRRLTKASDNKLLLHKFQNNVKVCVVELGYNHSFCHDLNNHTDIEVRLSVKS